MPGTLQPHTFPVLPVDLLPLPGETCSTPLLAVLPAPFHLASPVSQGQLPPSVAFARTCLAGAVQHHPCPRLPNSLLRFPFASHPSSPLLVLPPKLPLVFPPPPRGQSCRSNDGRLFMAASCPAHKLLLPAGDTQNRPRTPVIPRDVPCAVMDIFQHAAR